MLELVNYQECSLIWEVEENYIKKEKNKYKPSEKKKTTVRNGKNEVWIKEKKEEKRRERRRRSFFFLFSFFFFFFSKNAPVGFDQTVIRWL